MASSSNINVLPIEILQFVLSHFDYKTLLRMQVVCKPWKNIIEEKVQTIKNFPNLTQQMFVMGLWICCEIKVGEVLSQTVSRLEGEYEPEIVNDFKDAIRTICTFMGKPNIDNLTQPEMTALHAEVMQRATAMQQSLIESEAAVSSMVACAFNCFL